MSKKQQQEEELKIPSEENPELEQAAGEVSEESETERPEEATVETADAPAPEQEDFKNQYLRLRADFDNFRKRTRKEKEEWTQRCLENLCSDLLTVLDHFDLGIDNSKGKEFTEDTLKGFELVRGQLTNTLSTYGLNEVKVEGGSFDPNLHEAITHLPSPEVKEGEIVAVTRKGYKLGNHLLRPVQVVVSAGAPAEETVETEGEA
ncbi:MAG: nucleotide exchange factor GrpE [Kiritimatiellia bacterium]